MSETGPIHRVRATLGFLGALLAGAALPRAAWACAVCVAGSDDGSRAAFLVTTVFLSVLPLAAVGAIVWWLRRRARELEASQPTPRASRIRA